MSVRGVHLSGFPGWLVWMFVHLGFLTGFGNRVTTMLKWLRSMIGSGRSEREFSTAHTGGDLSLPDEVKKIVEPTLFPVIEQAAQSATTPLPDDGDAGKQTTPSPDRGR